MCHPPYNESQPKPLTAREHCVGTFDVIAGGHGDPRGRDEREFTRLYRESYGLVYNFVRYRMASDEAEDVVAEAYLLAARSFHKFDPTRAKFSTWVVRIAINCMADYYRKAKVSVDLEDVPEAILSVQGGYEGVEDRDLVDQLLGVLGEHEREIVLMKYREGKRNVDIAQELGMNASTVSTELARALEKMRVSLEGSDD
ncbi:MAG: sigma-70 family RNA polymerase sigma factor [Olsenella sp.]|nr:sigma-70 family RNA polymerase sigma factor [Olsenella sp.]